MLRELRATGQTLPVLVLSARDEISDKVAGLELGADGYLAKPFAFDELLARVRVQLRDEGSRQVTVLQAAGISLDLRTRRVTVAGQTMSLTAREFALLELFLRHPDQVLTRAQLLSHVWGFDFDPGSNVVDVYIGHLRRKLGAGAIETARGMGYRMVLPRSSGT